MPALRKATEQGDIARPNDRVDHDVGPQVFHVGGDLSELIIAQHAVIVAHDLAAQSATSSLMISCEQREYTPSVPIRKNFRLPSSEYTHLMEGRIC